MKKLGFTLVELLAVIAILAILIILVLPNILEIFSGAQKDTFLNEVKTIYKSAETQYLAAQIDGDPVYQFGMDDTTCIAANGAGLLNLQGNIRYKVIFDDGKIVYIHVQDENFTYTSGVEPTTAQNYADLTVANAITIDSISDEAKQKGLDGAATSDNAFSTTGAVITNTTCTDIR